MLSGGWIICPSMFPQCTAEELVVSTIVLVSTELRFQLC